MTTHDTSPLPQLTAPPAPPAPSAPARMTGRQRLIMILLLTASFTLAVDFSILNVALPRIGADVGFSLEHLQWIATSFALCAAGFTLFFGRVADLFGRKRLFIAGMALLGIGSLIGGLATDPGVLLAARVAQGLATAAVTPAALSLLTTSFPEGPLRDKALGLNGSLMAAGFTTGAILGGLLTDLLSWRWAFFINIPVAAFVLILAPKLLTESARGNRTKLDVPGAVTVTVALLVLVFGLTTAGEKGWTNPLAWGSLAAGAGLFIVFYFIERNTAHALVPVTILRRNNIAWGNIAGILAFATETSLVFVLTLYLQQVLGYTPLGAGLAFAVLGAGTVLGGLIAPKLIGRLGTKNTIITGLSVQAAATGSLLFINTSQASLIIVLIGTFVGGVANLAAIVGFMVTATTGLPDTEQGLATGLTTMSQQVGITMGIPVMSTIIAASLLQHGSGNAPQQVLDAVLPAIGINAVLCLATAALVGLCLRIRSAVPAEAS
ncbi:MULTISPECIES: MFS transporter [unclassified Arthrobacter]|uniref:MFS transporter n=1 Tax=unclassified Arthrobacter TaxID=235627 RepID=UPI002E00A7C8|nr:MULTISPECIES: MFS transporter [unclassified Arthrobacter]MEC5193116.1 EmrB/QacA subfamily drug resistance transporter [Arthrobacter sp. MP_M4]MEC5204606.1 EmrB/QacA subfamily drug resistance transporter [Arthrobacter sp. MP_M7]